MDRSGLVKGVVGFISMGYNVLWRRRRQGKKETHGWGLVAEVFEVG